MSPAHQHGQPDASPGASGAPGAPASPGDQHSHVGPGAPASPGEQHSHVGPGALADASVRAARVNDAPAIGLVQSTVWRQAYAAHLPDDVLAAFEPHAFAQVWRESLTTPPAGVHRLLVACAGDQVVGIASIGPSQDPDTAQNTGEITLLAVHPQARLGGHGSRLLNACVDLLREAGAESVTAWLPAADEATRAFLLASGLQPDSAYRDRVVSPEGATLREVRVRAELTEAPSGT